MDWCELKRLPNLLSLSRIAFAPAIVYFLWRTESWSTVVAALLFAVAGLTDWLDGYFARKRDAVTSLGIALDPIADKVFAVILVAGLILFREFPIWLAALIVGRDLLILAGGGYLLRHRDGLTLPSNLTGKWAFAALVVLLGAYLIRFQFGIRLLTPLATGLLLISLAIYSRTFWKIQHGHAVTLLADRSIYRIIRASLAVVIVTLLVIMLAVEFLN